VTTTIVPKIELPRAASKLKNGCWVLDAKQGRFADQGIVLGFHSGAGAIHPFATWAINSAGDTYWGHYHGNLEDALADFRFRS
jgi:hypothetical protein